MAVDRKRYLSIDETTGRKVFIRSIQTSAGAADANKILATDAAGKIDSSFLPATPSNPGGSNGQVQYNNNGTLAGANGFIYDPTSGAISIAPTSATPGIFLIQSASATAGNANGGELRIYTGTGSGTGQAGSMIIQPGLSNNNSGAQVTIAGGTGTGSGNSGGAVSISGGTGPLGGAITLTGGDATSPAALGGRARLVGGAGSAPQYYGRVGLTSYNHSLELWPDGRLEIDGQPGTSGQVLTSNGNSAAPTWQTPFSNYLLLSGGTLTGALTLNADPSLPLHAATKQYVDSLAAGLDPKASVRVATTASISISVAPSSIDGVTLANGDRVLVKNQSTASQNGIYVFNGTGVAMTRSADADGSPANEVTAGMFCFSTEGTANADKGWILTTNDPIVVGTTNLAFSQFSNLTVTPGGSNTQIQYNNSGVFGGIAGFTFNAANGELTYSQGNFGTPGAISIQAASTNAGGSAGNVFIQSGGANTVSGNGGNLLLYSGSGFGTGSSGIVQIQAGNGSAGGGFVGGVSILGGSAGASGVSGGGILIQPGVGSGSGLGGSTILQGGTGGSTGPGGDVSVFGGTGGTASGSGGKVNIAGGNPQNGNGGDVWISSGSGIGIDRGSGSIRIRTGAATGTSALGIIELGTYSTTAVSLTFLEGGDGVNNKGIDSVSLKAPNSITNSRTWTLPIDNPNTVVGKSLTTDANGNLSFSGYSNDEILALIIALS